MSRLFRHPGLPVLFACFLVFFGVGGQRQAFGVFLPPIEQDFGGGRAEVALVASLALLVFGLAQPLAGRVIDRRGARIAMPVAILLVVVGLIGSSLTGQLWQFALLYGILTAIGFGGTSNAPVTATIARHFTNRRGIALGFVAAGTPLGQFLIAPAAAKLVTEIGWRSTMAYFGLALLIVLPVVWLLLRRETPGAAVIATGVKFSKAIRSRTFFLLAASYFICGFTTLGLVYTHLVAYAGDLRIAGTDGAQALGFVGLFNIVGLLIAGHLGDRWGPRLPLAVIYGVRGLTLLWLSQVTTVAGLLVFAVIFGLVDMGTIPLTASAAAEQFGNRSLGELFGLIIVSHQIGSAAGAAVAGVGYSIFGGYPPVYVAGACLALTAAAFSLALPRVRQTTHPASAPA